MKELIRKVIPKPIRTILRWVYYFLRINKLYLFLADAIDVMLGRRDELTPPRRMIFVGDGDFKAEGEKALKLLRELGGLKPSEKVLDVGCGIGRTAVQLTKYLNSSGSYEGFDIVAEGIQWCSEKISPKYPNFHFQLADVYNKWYNPKGKYKASEYKFPFANETFDFIFLISVFTHMLPRDMENYFSEIVRVLKPTGKVLITFFLLNKESLQQILDGKSSQDFKYDLGEYRTTNLKTPEDAVSYDEKKILELAKKLGLKVKEPLFYGSWCGRASYFYQDVIVFSKQ